MAMSSLRCTKNNAVYMAELGVVAMLLLLTLASTSVHAEQGPNAARYDNYRLYRVRFENTEQVAIFQELERVSDSCIFYGHARQVGQSLTILVSAHKTADFAELLDRFAVEHAILNHNFQEAIDDQFRSVQPKTTPGNRLNWRHYFHLDTIHAWLDHLVESQPDFVQPLDIGRSFGGRQLRGVKLSRRRPGAEQLQRPGIFVEAGIHAREWISPATSTFLINQLVHSTDARVRELADAFDWYFVPVVNPDGYAFTFDSDRMWRKTRQPNGLCVGTDMNRNFDSHWNSIGSSSDPCAYDYAGRAVFSEPEAAAISTWMRANRNASRIDTYITLHSFSQLLLFPHSHTSEPVPNHADLLAIGREGVRALAGRYGTVYQTGSAYETIYPSSGGSMDWAYDEQRVPIAFTMELRGPPDSEVMFNLPADQIEPVGWETLDAIVAMLTEARRLGYYGSGEEACAAETAKV